jgi:biotin carboxyl carrier protein
VKYVVSVNGQEHEVTVDGSSVRVGGLEAEAHVIDVDGTSVRLVTISGRAYRVVARRGPSVGRYTIHLGGFRFDVEALDERTRAIRQLAGSAARPVGPAALTAPMPGLVVRVLAKAGERVHAGQGLVVIEAMKMENELTAHRAGKISDLRISEGASVTSGDVLATIE